MATKHRITLTDPATRAMQMRQHINAIAESIRTDRRADSLFEQVLAAKRHVHGYSIRNRLLQQWQAPHSRLVASLSAFDRIAADQGAEAVNIKGKPLRVMIRAGAKAVWIWGRSSRRRQFHDEVTGEGDVQTVVVSYIPVATWTVEDMTYAASGEPFELPDHVLPVDDDSLFEALLAFATHKGIEVVHRGIIGARGTSSGGRITLQSGDSEAMQLPILAHEVMHELLHAGRNGRDLPKRIVEGEAQAGAGVLLRMCGHDEPVTAAYLRNHFTRPQDVLGSMDRIVRAVGEVLDFMEKRRATDTVREG